MSGEPKSLTRALSAVTEYWAPLRLASINDYDIKVAKFQGEFVWHTHPDTDELFMVISGQLTIQLRDRDVVLGPQEVFVVPKGVEHCPKAPREVQAVLMEPKGTVNTGSAGGDMTRALQELE